MMQASTASHSYNHSFGWMGTGRWTALSVHVCMCSPASSTRPQRGEGGLEGSDLESTWRVEKRNWGWRGAYSFTCRPADRLKTTCLWRRQRSVHRWGPQCFSIFTSSYQELPACDLMRPGFLNGIGKCYLILRLRSLGLEETIRGLLQIEQYSQE